MKKENFLSILKEVTKKLEKNNITYEIPYTNINKSNFEHIIITVSNKHFESEILSIFKSLDMIKKDNRIIIPYDGVNLIFILINKDTFSYSFYYYCWDIVSTLINVYAHKMGLEFKEDGLYYKNNIISNNMVDNLLFFDLNKSPYFKGFLDITTIYGFITMSSYFNPHIYSIEEFEELDPLFIYNKKYYDGFLEYIKFFKEYEGYDYKKDYSVDIKDYFLSDDLKEETNIKTILNQTLDPNNALHREILNKQNKLIEKDKKRMEDFKNMKNTISKEVKENAKIKYKKILDKLGIDLDKLN